MSRLYVVTSSSFHGILAAVGSDQAEGARVELGTNGRDTIPTHTLTRP